MRVFQNIIRQAAYDEVVECAMRVSAEDDEAGLKAAGFREHLVHACIHHLPDSGMDPGLSQFSDHFQELRVIAAEEVMRGFLHAHGPDEALIDDGGLFRDDMEDDDLAVEGPGKRGGLPEDFEGEAGEINQSDNGFHEPVFSKVGLTMRMEHGSRVSRRSAVEPMSM